MQIYTPCPWSCNAGFCTNFKKTRTSLLGLESVEAIFPQDDSL